MLLAHDNRLWSPSIGDGKAITVMEKPRARSSFVKCITAEVLSKFEVVEEKKIDWTIGVSDWETAGFICAMWYAMVSPQDATGSNWGLIRSSVSQ
jgi:hypothetical protein